MRILSETVKINTFNAEVLVGENTLLWGRMFTQLVLEMYTGEQGYNQDEI